MTWRVLKGQRLNGTYGLDVSKPGFDVLTANIIQMAYTSDVKLPSLVVKGTTYSGTTVGWGPRGAGSAGNQVAGAVESVVSVGFGRTLAISPAAFAIATAPDWTIPLTVGAGQLGYLANQWHTFIYETIGSGTFQDYGGAQINKVVANTDAKYVDATWASAKFIMNVFNNQIVFRTNCRNRVTIKYFVLES